MKFVLITLAALAIFGWTSGSALAGGPHGGHRGYSHHGSDCCCGCQHQPSYYSPPYRYPTRYYPQGVYLGMTHEESVRRIMAEHSRDRYYTHPRSMYNSPPRYGYSRW